MKAATKVLAVALITVFGISNVMAQQGRGNKQCAKGEKVCMQDKFFSQLSEEQKEQMKTFRVNFTKEITPIKADLEVLKAQFKKASIGDNVNTKEVNKLIDQMATLKATMAKKHFAHKRQIRSILTDEQKVMFDAHHGNKMHKRGPKGRGQGKGMHGGQKMMPRAEMAPEFDYEEIGHL